MSETDPLRDVLQEQADLTPIVKPKWHYDVQA